MRPPCPAVLHNRRAMLRGSGCGFGALALAAILQGDVGAASIAGPLTPKPSHFPARAKRVIFLFMHGGPSQVDTFDYKPQLIKDHGKPLPFNKSSLLIADGQSAEVSVGISTVRRERRVGE